jgi:hypothetical protein
MPDEPAERDRAVAYLEHVSQCWMASAVARVRRAGCKVDNLPVLVGDQGNNKSRAIRQLCASDAWFMDDLSTGLASKDTKDSLNGKWTIERVSARPEGSRSRQGILLGADRPVPPSLRPINSGLAAPVRLHRLNQRTRIHRPGWQSPILANRDLRAD